MERYSYMGGFMVYESYLNHAIKNFLLKVILYNNNETKTVLMTLNIQIKIIEILLKSLDTFSTLWQIIQIVN